jgi:hypothetical protein
MKSQVEEVYESGLMITWAIVFLGCWIYAIATYGFLFGLGLGWLPSAIVAAVVSFFWPLIVIGIATVIAILAMA